MTQFVNVSFFCVPVHEDTTEVSVETCITDLKVLPLSCNSPLFFLGLHIDSKMKCYYLVYLQCLLY